MDQDNEKILPFPQKEQERNYIGKAEYEAFSEAAKDLMDSLCYTPTQKKLFLEFVRRLCYLIAKTSRRG